MGLLNESMGDGHIGVSNAFYQPVREEVRFVHSAGQSDIHSVSITKRLDKQCPVVPSKSAICHVFLGFPYFYWPTFSLNLLTNEKTGIRWDISRWDIRYLDTCDSSRAWFPSIYGFTGRKEPSRREAFYTVLLCSINCWLIIDHFNIIMSYLALMSLRQAVWEGKVELFFKQNGDGTDQSAGSWTPSVSVCCVRICV